MGHVVIEDGRSSQVPACGGVVLRGPLTFEVDEGSFDSANWTPVGLWQVQCHERLSYRVTTRTNDASLNIDQCIFESSTKLSMKFVLL